METRILFLIIVLLALWALLTPKGKDTLLTFARYMAGEKK